MIKNRLSAVLDICESRVMLAASYLDVIDDLPRNFDAAPVSIAIPKTFDRFFDNAQRASDDGQERGAYISEKDNGKLVKTDAPIGTNNSVQLNNDELEKKAAKKGRLVADFHTHPGYFDAAGKVLPGSSRQIPPGGADIGFASDDTTPGSFVRSVDGATYLVLDTQQTNQQWAQAEAVSRFDEWASSHYRETEKKLLDEFNQNRAEGKPERSSLTDQQRQQANEDALAYAAVRTAKEAQIAIYFGAPGSNTLTKLA